MTTALVALLAAGTILLPTTSQASGPNPAVIFETTMGRIIFILYPKEAPKTVENFLKYVDAGFYDGTIFHRIVREEDFRTKPGERIELTYEIIQGGGFDAGMHPKKPLFPPIKNESSTALVNKKGTIAMARGDNPDSATSQFFINVEDNVPLDYSMEKVIKRYATKEDEYRVINGYCAFGKIIRGMDVVEKISKVKRYDRGNHKGIPTDPIIIKRAYRPQ